MVVIQAKARRTKRVLVHGLPYFGKMFSQVMSGDGWDFRFYEDHGIGNLTGMLRYLQSCDLAYQIGGRISRGRFLRFARWMGKQKIVIHWCGSDVLAARRELAAGKGDPWIARELRHLGESEDIAREVRAMGMSCQNIPLPSTWIPDAPSALPESFSVLTYVPDASRARIYGLDAIVQVAKALPHVPFTLVGLRNGSIESPPANLRIEAHVADLAPIYKRSTVLWRPVVHDGLSFMVLEALGHGRHAIWTYPFPGCLHAANSEEAQIHIVRLFEAHRRGELSWNEAGARVVADRYRPQLVKKEIIGVLEDLLAS